MWVGSRGREDPLEEEMAAHSSVLAWRIPCAEEPGGCSPRGREESYVNEHRPHARPAPGSGTAGSFDSSIPLLSAV